MSDRFDVMERFEPLFEAPQPSFERFIRRRDRRRRDQRIAAGVVGIAVFLAALGLISSSPSRRSIEPAGSGRTAIDATRSILGLPNPDTAPSTPKHGQLVLHIDGNSSGAATAVWVYADGRIITGDVGGTIPAVPPTGGGTGFVEQHLTPAGVAYLQNRALSTGLFEHALELIRDAPGILTIQVLRGDRLVELTWAVDGLVPRDTPAATPEQANALDGLLAHLADPTSWPAYVWEDRNRETFVPARYQISFRIFPDQGDGPAPHVEARDVALLPAPARDLLRQDTDVRDATYELTTAETRSFAEALIDGGVEQIEQMPYGEAVTRFHLEDPYEPGFSLYVLFGPVLPHGEAIFLGPG